jgi:hypothetical protein
LLDFLDFLANCITYIHGHYCHFDITLKRFEKDFVINNSRPSIFKLWNINIYDKILYNPLYNDNITLSLNSFIEDSKIKYRDNRSRYLKNFNQEYYDILSYIYLLNHGALKELLHSRHDWNNCGKFVIKNAFPNVKSYGDYLHFLNNVDLFVNKLNCSKTNFENYKIFRSYCNNPCNQYPIGFWKEVQNAFFTNNFNYKEKSISLEEYDIIKNDLVERSKLRKKNSFLFWSVIIVVSYIHVSFVPK